MAAGVYRTKTRSPSAVVAEVYRVAGTLEFRLPGADPVPGGERQQPSGDALLHLIRAKDTVKQRLAAHPSDAGWAEAEIALDLLSGDHDSAMKSLGRASDAWPDAPGFLLYEGIAFAEDAKSLKREDLFGLAFGGFSRVIRSSRELRPVALFNRAILDERMFLFQRALVDWQWYLEIDSSAAWKSVARGRRDALLARLRSSGEKVPDLKELLDNLRSNQHGDIPVERMIDVAIREWLPRWSDAPDSLATLQAMASRVLQDHADPWLRDLLNGPRTSDWSTGVTALARATSANLSGQRNPAAQESEKAIDSFRRAGNRAGMLAARVERLYAVNRSLTVKACLAAGEGIEPELESRQYTWLLARYRIEISGCQSRSDLLSAAETNLKRALATSRTAHYPALELRALSVLANHHNISGNSTEAWNDCWAGINRFWSGQYGAVRGHTLYYNCSLTAERLGNPELALVLEQEASRFADQTPNRLQAAEGLFREGLLAVRLGDTKAAGRALARGKQALDGLPDDEVRKRYGWLLDKALAEGELQAGHVAPALSILDRFGATLPETEQPHWRVDYYRLRALASAQSGDRSQQYRLLTLATDETERALTGLAREDDRIRWRSQSGSVFRPLVELTLAEPDGALKALQLWEWYLDRAVETRGEWTQSAALPLAGLHSATLLSFFWWADHVGYWTVDDRGAAFTWAPGSASKIAGLCRRFSRQCSDESVPEAEVRRTARDLYDQLFGTAGSAFKRQPHSGKLLIEADGELGSIPFEALVDPEGRYLAESSSIVYSSGLRRWDHLRAAPGVSADSQALVVAAPAVNGALARQFPPLPDARREGEMVAGILRHSSILAGRNGTLPAVMSRLGTADIFHFSGHGLANSEDGALLLAPGGADEEGSLLTTAELSNQSLSRCRLAVLSACSSGVGESKGPVNPNSLVNGLLRAGVRDIVASRWRIDSASTFLLMRNFYGCLSSTGDPGTALQDAARKIRGTSGMSHPHYWASFSTFGE